MAERMPLPVNGYTTQSDEKINIVNANKVLEEHVLRAIDTLTAAAKDLDFDPRWIAIARTQIEQGFMALNRAVFRPQRLEDAGGLPNV